MSLGWPILRGMSVAAKKKKAKQSDSVRVRGWCTIMALTRGIYPVTVEMPPKKKKNPGFSDRWSADWLMVQTENPRAFHPMLREGVDFFRTRKDALQNAKDRADRLIAELRIRIAKVENIRARPRVLDRDPTRRNEALT